MDRVFNLNELSSEIAQERLSNYITYLPKEVYDVQFPNGVEIDEDGEVRYTEEAQEMFNDLYDEAWAWLESISDPIEYKEDNKELIQEIKSIISKCGEFSFADVLAVYSPEIKSIGNLTHLAEHFTEFTVEVWVYGGWENAIDSYEVAYEDLDKDTLESIFEFAQKWEKGETFM